MHDIFVNGRNNDRNPYYHIFINVNTRKAFIEDLPTKTAVDVKKSIKKFLSKTKCKKLISDAESAFSSDEVLNFLKSKGVDVQINDEQNHKTLGIIDRFIRTIRDKWGSNKPIDNNSIKKIIAVYNNTVHSATGLKPNDMDKKHEIAYIMSCIKKQEGIVNNIDYNLNVGDFVRLIKQTDSMTKKRRTITKHYYTVDSINKNRIVIMARDGSTQTVSRSDCILIKKNTSLSQAASIRNGVRGTVDEIVKYYPHSNKYKVRFVVPSNDKPYYSIIPVRALRAQFPLRITAIEREFFNKQLNDKKYGKI